MAYVLHGGTLPDSANKSDFYAIIDNATVHAIENADISDTAAIADTKLAQIATASKVSGAALTSLSSIPSGAGVIPSANLPSTVPSGIICMWSGTIATIPSGWNLCDGNNSTPDLRDRFIVGAKQDDSGVAKTNVTGSLTQSGDGSIPSHTHGSSGLSTNSTGAHSHKSGVSSGSPGTTAPGAGATLSSAIYTSTDGNHSHTISGSIDSYGTGSTNIAVYYALAFIMKS